MKTLKYSIVLGLLAALFFSSCSSKKIVYMQDVQQATIKKTQYEQGITLQPGDQILILVSCRDPQISALFNQAPNSNRIAGTETLNSSYLASNSSSSQSTVGYTINSDGNITFPVFGKVNIVGLNREQVAEKIKSLIENSNQAKDPVVSVEYLNLGISILGEVKNPGRIKIDREHFSILDALSAVGDMTIYGNRKNVTLIRKGENGDEFYKLDFTKADDLYASPVFFVQQGDVIYVSPNKKKVGDSSVNGNTLKSVSFWMSMGSFATSAAVLINNLVKNK